MFGSLQHCNTLLFWLYNNIHLHAQWAITTAQRLHGRSSAPGIDNTLHFLQYTHPSTSITMPPLHPSSAAPISILRHPLELRSLLPSLHDLAPRLLSPDTPLLPTRTTPFSRTLASLLRRQTTVTATASPIIPATYSGLDSGPTPGTVVGIVFGSVAGFLLLLWLIYTCFGLGGGAQGSSSVVEEEVIRRRSRSPPRRAPSRRSSPRSPRRTVVASSVSESEVVMEEVPRERTPPPRRNSSRRAETIIVEETIRRAPPAPQQDAFVEVIEEHDEPPPRRSRKAQGFTHIDPEALGGGDGKFKRVPKTTLPKALYEDPRAATLSTPSDTVLRPQSRLMQRAYPDLETRP
ncbi:hypothetical protein HO173_012011 [Letharia columbiana]|uniref:Uncharacterized protein n=1 Tax=Letharia columbiana TaxID=112416 RepID=A0A8H6CQW2_9LECA|nr:uncharacterized protein HO173_012011 [Letharia columbiana]KAF6227681.1 hypothetical protein HO173_012011 [Letharia columbiana]